MPVNDGGPAFARPAFEIDLNEPGGKDHYEQDGMSRRFYAATAITAACAANLKVADLVQHSMGEMIAKTARFAYLLADELIAQEKGE